MASKAKFINNLDKQSSNSKLIPSSKVANDKLLSSKLKLKPDHTEALKISKYIIEKVLLPKILGKPAPKKKKIVPAIVPEPEPKKPEPKKPAADAKQNAAKSPVLRPRRLTGIRKKPPVEKEPTHKDQFTTTDDLNETEAKAKGTKRGVKAKPRSGLVAAKKKTAASADSKDQLETIGEANIEEISTKDADLAANVQGGGGGGDGGLIISEITVKFCRRN